MEAASSFEALVRNHHSTSYHALITCLPVTFIKTQTVELVDYIMSVFISVSSCLPFLPDLLKRNA